MQKSLAITIAASLAALLSVSGCTGEKKSPPQPEKPPAAALDMQAVAGEAAAGKDIYFRYCHFCHGQKGMGDGPVGIALSPHPADFVNDAKRMSKTDAELFKSITEGIHKEVGGESMSMPRWQEILSEKERWDVLAFIRQLEREGKAAPK
ncbi:MAG: hypothetical protein A2X93_02115 [Deltaproteobacteria bacterium GWC2_56_8]|nr:MAG: hypothetical protein A2X99_06835 [Deltaproteobacteria bacterium GWB2_55_19]OGP33484.1 MAG: hypothetical protein A2X93_02115 [Deltaproteobacteria bacterium GWC2_56_8]HAO94119.1 hypothetical protein [Deltaproteobacteria bacterium]